MLSRSNSWQTWRKVYTVHFLFMWNMRTYEFASIILLSQAFPHNLTAASMRGITSTLSSMLCSSVVGSWIDNSPSRSHSLLVTIFANHGAILAVYLCYPFLASSETSQSQDIGLAKASIFVFILFLDVIHDLSAIANRLTLEQNWIPALVRQDSSEITNGLTQVNAVVRRIDLLCKLIAPSVLPIIISKKDSGNSWILWLAAGTAIFWILEVWCARIIARENPQLSNPKEKTDENGVIGLLSPRRLDASGPYRTSLVKYDSPVKRLRQYFMMPIWPASFSRALHHMTVLVYGSAMITYLLQVGFSLTSVTIARGTGVTTALASTFTTPVLMRYLHERKHGHFGQQATGYDGNIARKVGLWGAVFQFICVLPVAAILWRLSPADKISSPNYPSINTYLTLSLILFTFLSLSRIGLWTFNLMLQELEQVEIPESQRSTFAGTEQSICSMFELSHWGMTVLWNRPEDFKWLAVASCLFLGAGVVLYGKWCKWGEDEGRGEGEYGLLPVLDERVQD